MEKNKEKFTFQDQRVRKKKGAFPPLNPPQVYTKKKNTITRSPIELVGLCIFSPNYILPSKQLTNYHLLKSR